MTQAKLNSANHATRQLLDAAKAPDQVKDYTSAFDAASEPAASNRAPTSSENKYIKNVSHILNLEPKKPAAKSIVTPKVVATLFGTRQIYAVKYEGHGNFELSVKTAAGMKKYHLSISSPKSLAANKYCTLVAAYDARGALIKKTLITARGAQNVIGGLTAAERGETYKVTFVKTPAATPHTIEVLKTEAPIIAGLEKKPGAPIKLTEKPLHAVVFEDQPVAAKPEPAKGPHQKFY